MSRKIHCPVCRKDESIKLFEKQRSTFVKCINDGLVYINPQPDQEKLQEIYDTYGRELFVLPESIAAMSDYPHYRRRFLNFRRTNRLLEIGTAAGGFLLCCQKDGWDTYGVELSTPSSEFARKQYGLNVISGTIHDAGYRSNFFDIVVAWQTMEHIPNPRQVIIEVYRVLRPGGFFVLSVPCWEGLSIRLLKDRYRYVGRDHLFYFSRQNLRQMLSDIGFSHITSKTRGFNPIVCIEDGIGLTKKWRAREIGRDPISNVVQEQFQIHKPLKAVHKVYCNLIERLNLGDTLFAEGIKE